MYPNSLSFRFFIVSMIVSSLAFVFRMSSFLIMSFQLILNILRQHFISNSSSFFLSVSFRVQVPEAYQSTLKTHIVRILSLFWMVDFLPFHTCLSGAIVPAAFPIHLLISSEQLLSQVIRLPRYSNLSTFSMLLLPICVSCSIILSLNTMVLVFPMFTISPACSATTLVSSSGFCRDLQSSPIRSMSSANLSLFTSVPFNLIPQLVSFTWSITRSRYTMNSNGVNESPCRVSRSVWNHSP